MASLVPESPDALLTRDQVAAALTAAGFPVMPKTLATKVSRGGGPPFRRFGVRPMYRWGDALAWAEARLNTPRLSTPVTRKRNQAEAVLGGPRNRASAKSDRAVIPEHGVPATSPPSILQQRFRIAQVAEAFGCAPRTVRSWIEKGLLQREKIGAAVFIREDQIEAMVLGSPSEKKYSKVSGKCPYSKKATK